MRHRATTQQSVELMVCNGALMCQFEADIARQLLLLSNELAGDQMIMSCECNSQALREEDRSPWAVRQTVDEALSMVGGTARDQPQALHWSTQAKLNR